MSRSPCETTEPLTFPRIGKQVADTLSGTLANVYNHGVGLSILYKPSPLPGPTTELTHCRQVDAPDRSTSGSFRSPPPTRAGD